MDTPSADVLNMYLNFSTFTDPGEYAYLYNDLPGSLEELCTLVKKQLIHPFEVDQFSDKIPKDRRIEDRDFPTVFLMLKELLVRDKNGIVVSRKPEDRLVVACVHHCMLLASILRHKGIPVRIRSGFANYIGKRRNIKVSHVICEVWDEQQKKWILVDPDREKVDFNRNEFEFSSETWELLRKHKLKSDRYFSRYDHITQAIVHLLIHDISYILVEEKPYWLDPDIVSEFSLGMSEIPDSTKQIFDLTAGYLSNPDKVLGKIKKLRTDIHFLQIDS